MAGWVGRYVSQSIKLKKRTQTLASVVQEHYLRDDISCGSAACHHCTPKNTQLPESSSHYLIPDADAILAYLEILELPQVTGVIYLSSVVQEVYQRSTQKSYNRLRSLYTDPRRNSTYFDDRHFLYTWLMLKDRLSVDQKSTAQNGGWRAPLEEEPHNNKEFRSLAAVQVAAEWFSDHLDQKVTLVILSEVAVRHLAPIAKQELGLLLDRFGSSVSLQPKATEQGWSPPSNIEVLPSAQYFARYWRRDNVVADLYDSLVQARDAAEAEVAASRAQGTSVVANKGGPSVRGYLTEHAVNEGLNDGSIRLGVFQVSAHAPLEGFVQPSQKVATSQAQIFVPDRRLQNRAIAGDFVAVRLLPHHQWRKPQQTARPSKANESRIKGPLKSLEEQADEDEIALEVGPTYENEDKLPHETGPADAEEDVKGYHSGEPDVVAERLLGGPEVGTFGEGTPGRGTPGEGASREGTSGEGGLEGAVPTGEIVRVMQRVQRDYVACLRQEDEEELARKGPGTSRHEALLCVLMDRKIPFIRLRTSQGSRLAGKRFVLRIDGWEKTSQFPHGHMVRLLGPIGDLDAECESLLVENDIKDAPFTAGALQELPIDSPQQPWTISVEELASRRDVRSDHFTCSIDPPGSKDVDDALSVKRLQNGLLEIGVHIADVSYFVHQGGLLDLEARARGTTVYLVDRRLDMLPAVLSENLCSLLGGVDRLAMSVIWTVDPAANYQVQSTWFGRTVIHSRHQMAYEQAQMILERRDLPAKWQIRGGQAEVARIRSCLDVLVALTEVWRNKRKENGALELASAELRFEVNEKKEPVKVQTKKEILMNSMVAELMIGANASVARRIYESFPSCALLRRHPPPRLDGFQHLLECCKERGFTLDTSTNKALAASLEQMCRSSDPVVEMAVKAMATRAMSEAEYFSTGQVAETTGFYHYGLALEFYTHFTSPIRRYADIVAHRHLMAALQLEAENGGNLNRSSSAGLEAQVGRLLLPPLELERVAEHINQRHRASKAAQKECSQLYLLLYLAHQSQAEEAVVTSVQGHALMVFVPKYDLRGPVYLQDKQGRVIPPSSSDETKDDLERNLETAGMSLLKEGKSISIMRAEGVVLHQFHLLQSVWVELRADGSRAHAPTLRIRLLSRQHPAVRAAAANKFSSQPPLAGPTARPSLTPGNLGGSAAGARHLGWQAQAMAAARGQKDSKADDNLKPEPEADEKARTGGRSRGEVEAASVHSIVESFKEALTEADVKHSEAVVHKLCDLPVFCKGETIGIENEKRAAVLTRQKWQKNLMQASRLKARRARSLLAETNHRQLERRGREGSARGRANQMMAKWILLTHSRPVLPTKAGLLS